MRCLRAVGVSSTTTCCRAYESNPGRNAAVGGGSGEWGGGAQVQLSDFGVRNDVPNLFRAAAYVKKYLREVSRKMITKSRLTWLTNSVAVFATGRSFAQDAITVSARWEDPSETSVTVPTTQHLANSFTLRSHPFNKPLLKALQNFHTDDRRVQRWFSNARQVLPKLKEPTAAETFWDLTYVRENLSASPFGTQ